MDIENAINTDVSDNYISGKSTVLQMTQGKWERHIHRRGVMSLLVAPLLYVKIYVNRIDLENPTARNLAVF